MSSARGVGMLCYSVLYRTEILIERVETAFGARDISSTAVAESVGQF